jgi:hypothetical protein
VFVIPLWIINAYTTIRFGLWQIGLPASIAVVALIVWQWQRIEGWLVNLRRKAIDEYHVKPGLFAVLYVASFVPFYIGLFMMAEGALSRSWILVGVGGLINRFAFAMPYIYPLFWGTLPKKLKVAVWAWLIVSFIFFVATRALG